MITKLAKFRLAGRGRALNVGPPNIDPPNIDPMAAPANDNHRRRRTASVLQRLPRRVLQCRWHKTPQGALECRWHEGSVAEQPSDLPGISWWHGHAIHLARRSNSQASDSCSFSFSCKM